MTRLTHEDVAGLAGQWPCYEKAFRRASGTDLATVAAVAVGRDPAEFKEALAGAAVAVVTITAGEGEIGGFGLALVEIARFLGFSATLSEAADVAGLAEAAAAGADLVLCSDDGYFGALNFKKSRAAENSWATGLGYAEMLNQMAGGLNGQTVHLTGAGPVGRAAAAHLDQLGASVIVYDPQAQAAGQLAARLRLGRVGASYELAEAQKTGGVFCQAAPDSRALDWTILNPAASLVVHPAVPLGLPESGRPAWEGRLWFDPLPLGTAVMLAAAL